MGRKRKKRRSKSVVGFTPPSSNQQSEQPPSDQRKLPAWLAPATAVILVLAGGVAYGILTHRWTRNDDVAEAAAKLPQLPKTIGDWTSEDHKIEQRILDQAGAAGYLSRTYHLGGHQVSVMILCGSPGPISLHPPTVCFTSAGWELNNQRRTTVSVEKNELGTFQAGNFQKPTTTGPLEMTTYWAWNHDGKWQAPDRPRYAFADAPHLYKIYVSVIHPRRSTEAEEVKNDAGKDTVEDFLKELIPALRKIGI